MTAIRLRDDALGSRRHAHRAVRVRPYLAYESRYARSLSWWQRLVWFLAGAALGVALGGAVGILRAAEEVDRAVTQDTIAAANEAGVSLVDLLGAMATTGLSGRSYLLMTGELAEPSGSLMQAGGAPDLLPRAPSVSTVWDRLAACESTSRWNVNTGNGYYGGLQQDMTFWRRHGGLAYAPRPDLAPRTAQIAVAQRGQTVQGWGAWPVCSRRLGLR